MNLNQKVKDILLKSLSKESFNEVDHLNNSLRLLSKWRSILITNTYIENEGLKVFQGPFKGMNFLRQSSEGCHVAKLLGTYEQPLHNYLEEIIAFDYNLIINIGSAEGYYSVGLAMRSKVSRVISFDINKEAQNACKELAIKNDVEDSIQIECEFHPSILKDYKHTKSLLICDVEGDEKKLLDIINYSEFNEIDILVESHECLVPGITEELINRFSSSHKISLIQDDGQRILNSPPEWFFKLAHLDQLLSTWEWRSGATPWIFMRALKTN
tara:strand:- start:587 stop:1396 length:810 start_codon:yes stop_codon:yes gene_type:complete